MRQRISLLVVVLIAMMVAAAPARGGEFTFTKDITMISPLNPGSVIDAFGQKFKKVAEKYLNGRTIIIEYKPGGSTSVGMNYMLTRPRDGYTMILNGNTTEFGVATGQTEGYDENDYLGLCNLGSEQTVVFTYADSPFASFTEVIEFARKNPGKINWGASGVMSQNQFFALQVMEAADVELNYIPYDNGNEVIISVLGKNLDVGAAAGSAVIPYVKDGKIRILAQGMEKRGSSLPDVPTAYETPGLDYSKFGFPYWSTRSMAIAAGTPEEALRAWDELILKTVADPEWKEFLATRDIADNSFMTRPQITKYIRDTTASLRELFETLF